jgi:hypothetical protein
MFVRHRGKTKIMYFKGDTAVQVREGSLVMLNDSASVSTVRNDSTNDKIIGVARRSDTTTDSALVPIEVPVESAVEWLIDTDTVGGAADSDVGRFVTVDTEGGTKAGDSCAINVDVSDSQTATIAAPILITGIVSATKVIGVIAHTAFHIQYDTAM